jgi:hypothetical protein
MAEDRHRVAFPVMLDITPYAVQTENRYPYQLDAVSLRMNLLFQIVLYSNLDATYSTVIGRSQIAHIVIFQ